MAMEYLSWVVGLYYYRHRAVREEQGSGSANCSARSRRIARTPAASALVCEEGGQYNAPISRHHIVKTVNVRQLMNNPSDGLLGEPGVRLAIATDLYKNGSISVGRGSKIAGMALAEFMQEMGRAGIPVIRGDAKTLREELKNLKAWRARK